MLVNVTTGETLARHIVRCDTFLKRGRGLMFRGQGAVAGNQVYLFVERRASIAQTAIHMFFVFFSISVLWLDSDKRVVDKALARPFRPYYAPRSAAKYFVEGHPSLLDRVGVGDQLEFESRA